MPINNNNSINKSQGNGKNTFSLDLHRLALIKNRKLYNHSNEFVELLNRSEDEIREEFIRLALEYKILTEEETEDRIDKIISCYFVELIPDDTLIDLIEALLEFSESEENIIKINNLHIKLPAVKACKQGLFNKLIEHLFAKGDILDYVPFFEWEGYAPGEFKVLSVVWKSLDEIKNAPIGTLSFTYSEENPKPIRIKNLNLRKILETEISKKKDDISRIVRETYNNLNLNGFLSSKERGSAIDKNCFLYDTLSFVGFIVEMETYDKNTKEPLNGIRKKKYDYIKNRLR